MVRQYVIPTAFAFALAGAAVSAQQTTGQQTQPPQAQQQAMDQAETRTVEGCVYKEEDIPGRSPNIAERAGILEDYILVASADASTQGAVGTTGTAGATGTTGAAAAAPRMFKLEHEDDDKLRALVGKRVRVTGKVDAERGDRTAAGEPERDRSAGPDQIELPEFEVTTITETAGECPARPDVRR
ncbi:hypothetical protein BH23ACI1_BH23ACI1_21330 [soil metagenome]|nr:hypothetical protein [Acidobacteriota bacterium]